MIYYYSVRNKEIKVGLEEAVMKGLAKDGGLFMPHPIPMMSESFYHQIDALSFSEISFEVAKAFLQEDIPELEIKKIIKKAMNFDVPLKTLPSGIHVLELFYGPTLSFKDFGARFMAQLMGYFAQNLDQPINILVATSGDTGSAIAQAFLNVPNVRVWILYPKGKVSWTQELQLTTIGHNITALEIEGTFDDCQRLVKQAFMDSQLREKLSLTSANSINISRLIPQTFYYFYAYSQIKDRKLPLVFSIPSGNFGNLTAGLIAKKMGLPVYKFIAATNVNDSVPRYLDSGNFETHPTKHTLSNAMDVGNPSNFARMLDLYDNQWKKMRQDVVGKSFTDAQTKTVIREVLTKEKYLLDPHGAIGYLGLSTFLLQASEEINGIVLETAHPAKFAEEIEKIIHQQIQIPKQIQEVLSKEKKSIKLPNNYEDLKRVLLTKN